MPARSISGYAGSFLSLVILVPLVLFLYKSPNFAKQKKKMNSILTSTPLSGTPTITTQKLNWKNYLSWSASVELWFLVQEALDHPGW